MFNFETDHLPEWRQKEIKQGGYWVIPSRRTLQREIEAKTDRYWSVTITLTSGKVEQFYIKARTLQEAQFKAEGYDYLSEITLQKGGWRLLP